MNPSPNLHGERLGALDALRGCAALGVVIFHFVGFIRLLEIPTGELSDLMIWLAQFGGYGVSLFFILSGFVISLSSQRYPFDSRTASRFFMRRVVRLLPPLWISILLHAGSVLIGHQVGLFKNTFHTPQQILTNMLVINNMLGIASIDIIYWTLCLEFQFYLVYCLMARLMRSSSDTYRFLVVCVSVIASLIANVLELTTMHFFWHLWYEFALGVMIYSVTRETAKRWMGVAFGCCLSIVTLKGYWSGGFVGLIPAILALLFYLQQWFQSQLPPAPKPLTHVGRISYSLYLIHGIIGLSLGVVFRRQIVITEFASWCAIILWILMTIMIAELFYHLVEKRFTKLAQAITVRGNSHTKIVHEESTSAKA